MMMAWLGRLTGRERTLLGLGGLVGLVALAFTWIVEPIRAERAALSAALAEEAELAAWLRAQQEAHAGLVARVASGQAAAPEGPRSIAALEAGLRDAGLAPALTRLAPQASGQVELAFEALSYTDLIAWLRDAGLDHRLDRASVTAGADPDRVDARLTLSLEEGF